MNRQGLYKSRVTIIFNPLKTLAISLLKSRNKYTRPFGNVTPSSNGTFEVHSQAVQLIETVTGSGQQE